MLAVAVVAVAVAAVPRNTSAPTVTGTARIGETLIAGFGEWADSPSTFAYRWERCAAGGSGCADIPEATRGQYTPVDADVGHTLRVAVTATNADGMTTASSAATNVVASTRPATAPTIVFLSLAKAGTSVRARFRVCDQSGAPLTVTARAKGVTHRFAFTTTRCVTASRTWAPRLRGHGSYVVTLTAVSAAGTSSRSTSRSLRY